MLRRALTLTILSSIFLPVFSSGQSLPNYLPTSGLVAWWPFDGNANDASGNGNDGTVSGATLTTDRNGNANSAYYFSSASCATRIDVNVNTSSITSGLTIQLWAKREGNGCIGPRLMEFWANNGAGQAQWGWDNSNSGITIGSRTSTSSISKTLPVRPDNVWTQLVYTNDGTMGRFFQDGVLVDSIVSTGTISLSGNGAFGRMNHAAWDAFNGSLDDIGIWNRALSGAEVSAMYSGNALSVSCNLLLSNNEVICNGDSLQLSANVSAAPTNSVDASKFTLLGHFDGKAYYESNSTATYQQALQAAQSMGAELLKIDNAQLNQYIASNISQVIMLGATDSLNEGSFTYPDGSSLTYSNWSSGEPNNQQNMNCPPYTLGEDYIALAPNGKWNDIPNFVCSTLSYQYKFGISIDTSQTNNGQSILWSTGDTTSSIQVSPSQTTTYWVTDGNGCYDTVVVQVLDSQINSSSSSICTLGDSVLLWNGFTQMVSAQNIGSCSPLSGTLANGLIGWYPFCGNANDESTLGNDGVVYGASLVIDRYGVSNRAYEFDITSTGWGSAKDRIVTSSTGVSSALSLSNAFTISAWVNLSTKPGNFANRPHSVLGIWDGTGTAIVRSQITYSGQLNTQFPSSGASAQSTSTLSYGQWHHVVQSFDGDSIYQYIDGVQVNSKAVNFTIPLSTATMTIGEIHMANGHWYHFSGLMDELGIWDRALSKAEIQSLANSGVSSLTWSTGETGDSIWVKPTATTTYTLTQSLGGASCSDSITIKVDPVEIASTSSVLCLGDSTTLSVGGSVSGIQSLYSEDFEGAIGPEWNSSTSMSYDGSIVLGNFDNTTVTLSLANLPTDTITISFDLWLHDTWDGNHSGNGPDFWSFKFNQATLLNTTFNNHNGGTQSYPDNHLSSYPSLTGNVERITTDLCSGGQGNTRYSLEFKVYNNQSTGTFSFIGNASQSLCDESWSIDNVVVSQKGGTSIGGYTWSTGDTTSSIHVSPTQTTTYWATNGAGCFDTLVVEVVNINIIGDTAYCIGDEVVLTTNYRHTDSLNCDTSYFHGYDANYTPGQTISGYAYKGLHNGHHYYLANNPTKWTRAAQNAKYAGGHLVCINNAAEQAFIQNLSTSNLWIGLYRNSFGDFDWVNCDTLVYTNWRSNEPGNNEPYVHILTDNCFGPNQWNDLGDSSTNGTCYSNCYGVLEIDPNSSYSNSGSSVSWNSQLYQDTLRFSFSKDTTISVSVTINGHTCHDTVSLFLRGDSLRIPIADEYICEDDTLIYTLPSNYNQSIQWFDMDTSRIRYFSTSGNYFVQGLDSSGCYIEDTLQVTINKVELLSSKMNLCPDEEVTLWLDSSYVISSLLWNTGSSDDTVTFIPDSSSVYWVNQSIGASTCYDSVYLNVSELSYSIDSIYSYNGFGVRCFGASDGGVTLEASSSFLPLQIIWSDSTSLDSLVGVEAGDYWFKITDSLGCSFSDTVSISEPTQVQSTSTVASSYNGFNISCNGLSDGKAYVQYQGGVPGYAVYVNGSLIQTTSDTLYGFNDGLHLISVVDSNGCSTQDTLNFNEPSFLNTTLTSNAAFNGFDVSCNGLSDGTITPTTNGGVTPYVYSTQNGTSLSNIIAGSYNVQTQDVNGCIRFDSITLTQPDPLVDQSSIISSYSGYSVSCFGTSDGKLELDFYGGVGPYQYQVNGNSVQSVIVGGLQGGLVSYQITDNNSCILSGSLTLSEPSKVNVSALSNKNYNGYDISCYGFSDGQASASAVGGTGQFTFLWNTLPPSNTSAIDSLNAGLYIISVADSNGCVASDTVLLSQPQPLLANAQQLIDYSGYGVSCYGASDGGIYAAAAGGVPTYNYIWNSGQYGQDSVSGLTQGTYSLLVEDLNGCKANSSITLTNPQIFATSVTSLTDYNGYDIKCSGGNSGIVLASSQGGVGPYSFDWSQSSNPSPLLSNLLAGQYDVTSSDANGCIDSASITLFEPQALSMTYVYSEPICYSDSNGTADLDVQGGVGPYSISWSNEIFGSYSDELWASTYYLTITDTNDCLYTDSVTITDSDPLGILVDTIPPTCDISNDGYINVMPYGGFTPYTITMNGSTIPNIVEGIGDIPLYITVSDQKGCDTSLTIDFSAQYGACLEIPNLFSPNGDNYNDVWNIGRFTEFDLRLKIYNPLGQLVYQSNSANYIPWDGLINGKNAPNGDYYYYLESFDLNKVYNGYVTVIR